MEDHDGFDAWLPGFIDGEGCFFIERNGAVGLIIRMRDDDETILRQIADRPGRNVRLHGSGSAQCRSSTRPDGLRRVVEALDANPLRAKKRHDYAVWREAAMPRIDGTQTPERLAEWREELMGLPGRVRRSE